MSIQASELILNKDGSIYHLGLLPEDLASTVIVVGDPKRVPTITKHFDKIEVKKEKREFCTHTGFFNSKRITVMSTGMGTDNIDIAFTELDALANIDFDKREIRNQIKSLDIIRIGTTGSLRKEIPVDGFVVSEMAIGFDSLMHYYQSENILNKEIAEEFIKQTNWSPKKGEPYVVDGDKSLVEKMSSQKTFPGFTATNIGFYGPQGRVLRLGLKDGDMNDRITHFEYKGRHITNMEMETSAIYGLSKLMGHKAVSMNAVLANRMTGEFTRDSAKLVENIITYSLERIAG